MIYIIYKALLRLLSPTRIKGRARHPFLMTHQRYGLILTSPNKKRYIYCYERKNTNDPRAVKKQL